MSRMKLFMLLVLMSFTICGSLSALVLDGIVVDIETAQPIAEAHVVVHGDPAVVLDATTDESGQFVIDNVTGGEIMLVVHKQGYQEYREWLFIENDTTLEIALAPHQQPQGYTVSGTVTDTEGNPAGFAWVSIQGEMFTMGGQVRPNGTFAIEHVPAGTYQLLVFANSNVPVYSQELVVEGDTTVDIVIENIPGNATLSGMVTDTNGTPLPGVEIMINAMGIPADPAFWAHSDETGHYVFPGIPEGEYTLRATAPGFAVYQGTITVSGATVWDIVLAEGAEFGQLDGSIFDAVTLEPLSGVEIVLVRNNQGHQEYTAISDEAGYYVFPELEPGPYMLHVQHENYQPLNLQLAIQGYVTMDLTMIPFNNEFLALTGIVTSSATGEPLPGLFLVLENVQTHETARTNREGFYHFHHLSPGTYNLIVLAHNHGEPIYNEQIEITETLTHDIVVDMNYEMVALSGIVTDSETGLPVSGAMVNLFVAPAFGYFLGETMTDENGAYFFAEVPDNTIAELHVFAPGYQPCIEHIEIAGETTFDVALTTFVEPVFGTVSGYVTNDADGTPLAGALVHLIPSRHNHGHWRPYFALAMTDENGYYEIQAPAREYYAICFAFALGTPENPLTGFHFEFFDDARNIHDATRIVVTENGLVENINFGIPAESEGAVSFVTGIITDPNGNPVTNATVMLLDDSGTQIGTVTTDSNGEYTVEGLIAGVTYQVDIEKNGFTSYTEQFSHAGMFSVVNGEMSPTTGTGDTTVPAKMALAQNFPNPFNPSTTISFSLPTTGQVDLAVFNARGQKITSLVSETLNAGTHEVVWTGKDDRGQNVASGIYFYQLSAGGKMIRNKMLLVK